MPELISCQSVGYRQQGIDIISNIDWQIERGQHWAVLGPNGSGKTTLLKIACGYLWPTSGRVLRLGEELIDLGELRRNIGWISSGMIAEIPPDDTALETVVTGRLGQFGLKRLPEWGPTEQDHADAAAELARLGCESFSEKRFGILSQGERQQVLIARARLAKPLLLVLDEPCAGMDPGVRERFLHWLNERVTPRGRESFATELYSSPILAGPRALRSRQQSFALPSPTQDGSATYSAKDSRPLSAMPTTILVTHHMEEIVPGIQNTLILRDGRVHAAGPTQDVVTRRAIEEVYQTKLARIERVGGRLWPIWDGQ